MLHHPQPIQLAVSRCRVMPLAPCPKASASSAPMDRRLKRCWHVDNIAYSSVHTPSFGRQHASRVGSRCPHRSLKNWHSELRDKSKIWQSEFIEPTLKNNLQILNKFTDSFKSKPHIMTYRVEVLSLARTVWLAIPDVRNEKSCPWFATKTPHLAHNLQQNCVGLLWLYHYFVTLHHLCGCSRNWHAIGIVSKIKEWSCLRDTSWTALRHGGKRMNDVIGNFR